MKATAKNPLLYPHGSSFCTGVRGNATAEDGARASAPGASALDWKQFRHVSIDLALLSASNKHCDQSQ